MIYAIANIVLIIIIKAIVDKKQISKGKGIAHSKEWAIVAICSLPAIYVFRQYSSMPDFIDLNVFNLIKIPIPIAYPEICVMCMGFIWFFFDGLLNKLRGKDFWYTGIRFAHSAKSDGFLQRFSPKFQKVIKFSALLIPILIYVYSYYTK